MSVNIKVESFVGNPNQKEWSQVVVTKVHNAVSCIIAVSLRANEESELLSLPELGLKLIEEGKHKTKNGSELTLDELKTVVATMLTGVGEGIIVSCGIVIVGVNEMVAAIVGDVQIELLRNTNKYPLLVGTNLVKGIKGKVQKSDCLMMLSKAMGVLCQDLDSREKYREMMGMMVHEPESSMLWGTVMEALEEAIPAVERNSSPLYVGPHLNNDKKYRNIGLGLFAFLILTVAVGAWRRQALVKQQEFARVQQVVADAHTQTMNVIKADPEQARRIIGEASSQIGTYIKTVKGKDLQKAQQMADELARYEKEVFKENEVTLLTFAELGLLGLSSTPNQMVVSPKGMLYFADSGEVVGISPTDKSQVKMVLEFGGKPIDFAFVGDNIYTLESDGIWGGNFKDKAKLSNLITTDDAWQTPSRIGVFGASLYTLDIGTGEISKYVATDGKLSERKRWFGKGIVLDLSKIVDMVVDGDVWLVSSSGKLEKYSRGVPAKFEMEGFANENGEKKFADPIAVATTETEVYVLERGKGRVVVFDRDGKYLRQYLNRMFGEGKDLVVWEGKGYVLTEKEIKVFGL